MKKLVVLITTLIAVLVATQWKDIARYVKIRQM